MDTSTHSLSEILINNKHNKINIILIAETNTNWKIKTAHDSFRKIIANDQKGTSVTTAETNISWDSIYKSDGTTIIIDNEIRSRKIKTEKTITALGNDRTLHFKEVKVAW